MTDILVLAKRLYNEIRWQKTPEDVTQEDLTVIIAESIRQLYVMTGRSLLITEDKFTQAEDSEMYLTFADTLREDEVQWVLVTSQLKFYTMVQSDFTDLVGFSTNAMTVTHGDKPFANLQQRIDQLQNKQDRYWYKMNRYHHLGGVVI